MERINGEWVMDKPRLITRFITQLQDFPNMIILDQIKLEKD